MVTEQLGRDSPLQAGSHTISHSSHRARQGEEMANISAIIGTIWLIFSPRVEEIFTDVLYLTYLTLPSVRCLVHIIVFH